MAKILDNVLLRGLQGSIGKQIVIKVRNGKPYVAKHPPKRTGEIPSEKQTIARQQFTRAQRFAQHVNKNAELKDFYTPHIRSGQTILNVAYLDAFYPPVVHEIDSSSYTGIPGQFIYVKATDNFKVVSVYVKILDVFGRCFDEGEAARSDQSDTWVYATSEHNEFLGLISVIAVAKDLAGNEGKMEIRFQS